MQNVNFQNMPALVANLSILAIIVVFVVLLGLYLWYAMVDILIMTKNYNFRKAKRCHWGYCGLYYHIESDPESKDCLSPFGRMFFENLSMHGNQPGCHYSIQIREIDEPRKPAADYQKEFLDVYKAFNVYNIWWKVITILIGIVLFFLGIFNLEESLKIIFR